MQHCNIDSYFTSKSIKMDESELPVNCIYANIAHPCRMPVLKSSCLEAVFACPEHNLIDGLLRH